MTPTRKKTQEFLLTYIDKIAQGGDNKELYKNLFARMSDKDFDKFMTDLRDDKITLSVIVPHDNSVNVSVVNNFKLAKELGYEFFQHLKITDPSTGDTYLTPNKYLVYRLSIRRTAQLLSKGISVPKDSRSVDMLTGQVANSSRSSKITMPEIQMLVGMGLDKSVEELVKYRGGDLGAKNALVNTLYKQGKVDKTTLDAYSTGVESLKTLKNYFLGAHIKSTGLG